MPISIRPALASDAEALHKMILHLARYERSEDSVRVTPEHLRNQLNLDTPPFECHIAEVDGGIAGFALYFYAYSTWEGHRSLYLEDLYVPPEFRSLGVGSALMSRLAQTALENDCRRFEWSVLDWNQPAIDFYDRIGALPLGGWTRYRLERNQFAALADNKRTKIAG